MGDFNIDLNINSTPANEYMKTLNSLGFSALINQPTRIQKYENTNHLCCSTLDHIITNIGSSLTKAGILISDVSDHLPVFASMKLSKTNSNPYKNTYRRSFSDNKKEKFRNCFQENIDKHLNFSLDPNGIMGSLLLSMDNTVNKVCSWKKVSRKQAKLILDPWMTKEILDERKIRDNLKKIYILNKCRGSDDHNNWKKQRNKVNRMIKKAKDEYTAKSCENAKGSSKKMWKVINKAINKKPKPNTVPAFIKTKTTNGTIKRISCKTEIANAMNRQFTEMGG